MGSSESKLEQDKSDLNSLSQQQLDKQFKFANFEYYKSKYDAMNLRNQELESQVRDLQLKSTRFPILSADLEMHKAKIKRLQDTAQFDENIYKNKIEKLQNTVNQSKKSTSVLEKQLNDIVKKKDQEMIEALAKKDRTLQILQADIENLKRENLKNQLGTLNVAKSSTNHSPYATNIPGFHHLIIDGQNVGWKAIRQNHNAQKAMKGLEDNNDASNSMKNKTEKNNGAKLKFNKKIFETAIISCVESLKKTCPKLKITLVIIQTNHPKDKLEKISKLKDSSCFILEVAPKTDDETILEKAKNDCRNTWILSNDKFRDWLEKKPGEYDKIIANRLISDFRFLNYGEGSSHYEFCCPKIEEKFKT